MYFLASVCLSACYVFARAFFFDLPFTIPEFLLLSFCVFLASLWIRLLGSFFIKRLKSSKATGQYIPPAAWTATCPACMSVHEKQRPWTRCPQCAAMLVPWYIAPEYGYEYKHGGRARSERT